jgi:hypothetical protein
MFRTLFIAATLALAACASTPTYTPASAASNAGYSERRIEADRYFVTYRAPNTAEAALLEDYALLRAADVTLENGREWFWLDRQTFEDLGASSDGPRFGIGIGGGSWGGSSGGAVGVGMDFPIGSQPAGRARAATLEIRFGEGAKPDDANAFDARSISESIRARLAP